MCLIIKGSLKCVILYEFMMNLDKELLYRFFNNATTLEEEKKIRLVLDECFIEFLEETQKYTMVKKVTDHACLFLVQAFTKMYGIPGLRLGYAMTSDGELRERMQQIRQPWSVSVPAQAAGIEALTEREDQRVQKIRKIIF